MVYVIVGGTGTFGTAAVRHLLARDPGCVIRVVSRDEFKQSRAIADCPDPDRVRYMLGDARDLDRMRRACEGATYVFYAAALKRIEAVQRDVDEALSTNVLGAKNVAQAALEGGAEACVLVSSDKAADPVNAYGATKLMAEHLYGSMANAWGVRNTRLVSVRYGNVIGSRGSVIELWMSALERGLPICVNAKSATRYWLHIDRAIELARYAARELEGGTLAVPYMQAARMGDLAQAFADYWKCEIEYSAMHAAEKLHECSLTAAEMGRALIDWGGDRVGSVYRVGAVDPSLCAAKPGGSALTSDTAPPLEGWQLQRIAAGTVTPDDLVL